MQKLLLAASLLLPLVATAQSLPVANAGFEQTLAPDDAQPRDWRQANGAHPLDTDAGTAFEGGRSLRLTGAPPFIGSAQSVDAKPWQGRRVVLSAHLKGAGIGDGTAGLWLRGIDGNGMNTAFATSYRIPLRGDTGWERREVEVLVGKTTERLVFGAALGAPGTLWVDAIELHALDTETMAPPSGAARTYLEAALALIEREAYFSPRVDWPRLRAEVDSLAAGAVTPGDTHVAIAYALEALGDGHSHFVSPRLRQELASAGGDEPAQDIEARSMGRVGYLRVPGFQSIHPARGAAFSDTLRGHLARQAAAGACGWIVDLRANTGGNMYPMVQGLSGLLGGETLGHFVGREQRVAWTARTADGGLHALAGGATAPVAVLQGPRTASSGEATLLSFHGRANTRSFGEPSWGLSTANQAFPLADGAAIALTTALMADRDGKPHGGKIQPDEVVSGDQAAETAARRWLESQPACAG
jgi:hypothetical protein